jgi:hypothetical protein
VKISKTTWVFAAIGAAIIGGICLFMALNQQTTQKADLENKLNEAKQKLTSYDNEKLITQKENLNLQIDEYSSQSKVIKDKLAFGDDNINITEKLIQNASDYKIAILEISSPGTSNESLGAIKTEAMNVTVKAQGTIETIAGFVFSLKKVFPTCVIKSVTIDIVKPVSSPGETPAVITVVALVPGNESEGSLAPDLTLDQISPTVNQNATTAVPFLDTVAAINLVIYNYKGN